MADKEIRIAVGDNKVESIRIIDLNSPPSPSTAEKVVYFLIGIPVLIYFIVNYCLT